MAEFANYHGRRIQIGTCENLYYLRYDDRHKVDYDFGKYQWYWRLPFLDEDEVSPGDYREFQRGERLYTIGPTGYTIDFTDEETVEHPGRIQLHHPSGLLLSVPCYHGHRLPDVSGGLRAGWNGKTHSFELASVKNDPDWVLWPIVRCRHCGEKFRYEWEEILPYVPDKLFRRRLEKYAAQPTKELTR